MDLLGVTGKVVICDWGLLVLRVVGDILLKLVGNSAIVFSFIFFDFQVIWAL